MAAISITTQPTPTVTVKEGEAHTYSISASDTSSGSKGVLSYQWEKINTRTGEYVPIVGAIKPTYTIPSITETDANTYRCVVKNTYKEIKPLKEILIKDSNGNKIVDVDDEYLIGYRSFTVRTDPSTVYKTYPKAEAVSISSIETGRIAALKIISGGDLYTPGTYSLKSLSNVSSSGLGAIATFIVSDLNLNTTLVNSGQNYLDGVYNNIPLLSPKTVEIGATVGRNAKGNVLISNGKVRKVQITNSGINYSIGNELQLERPLELIKGYASVYADQTKSLITCTNHGLTDGDLVYISRFDEASDPILTKIFFVNTNSFYIYKNVVGTKAISSISKASQCKITSTNHNLIAGQIITISNVGGMTVLNENDYKVLTVVDSSNFIIANENSTTAVDSSSYGTYTSGGVFSLKLINVGYVSVITPDQYKFTVTGIQKSNSLVTTSINHNFIIGQKVHFSGLTTMIELNGLSGTIISDSFTTTTFRVDIDMTNFTNFSSGTGFVYPMKGATGNNATFRVISKKKSSVISASIITNGIKYALNDTLSVASADVGSSGSDFRAKVVGVNTKIVTGSPHGLGVGDIVGIDNVTGMTEINKLYGTITEIGDLSSFILNIDSSNFNFNSYTSNSGIVILQLTATLALGEEKTLSITSKPS